VDEKNRLLRMMFSLRRAGSALRWLGLAAGWGVLAFSLAHPVHAQAQPILAPAIHLVEEKGSDSIGMVIDLSARPAFQIQVMAEPKRITIDLENTLFTGQAGGRSSAKPMGSVAGFRAGLFMAGQSRIVMDLARPALVERADFIRQDGVERLVILIRPASEEAFSAKATADAARREAARASLQPAPPAAKTTTHDRPVVVLDPGHGGIDSGATGPKGEMEKEIALTFALAVKAKLEASGKVHVAMTREDDRFIPLGARVAFAREKRASLFISLHADSLAGEGDVRGASVYTLSERATDAAAERAAEKENRVDQLAGLDVREDNPEGVDTILFDLARRETRLFSQVMARDALAALKNVARLHKSPQRAAGFRVLRAGDIPSILIELGYLSNAEDVAFLTNKAAQARAAEALAQSILNFVQAGRATP
jgi:N-acetylmuramoyl-L-alanine amidase